MALFRTDKTKDTDAAVHLMVEVPGIIDPKDVPLASTIPLITSEADAPRLTEALTMLGALRRRRDLARTNLEMAQQKCEQYHAPGLLEIDERIREIEEQLILATELLHAPATTLDAPGAGQIVCKKVPDVVEIDPDLVETEDACIDKLAEAGKRRFLTIKPSLDRRAIIKAIQQGQLKPHLFGLRLLTNRVKVTIKTD